MKKHLIIIGKALGFFILWGLSLTVLSIPGIESPAFINNNAAFLRLWWELLPLLGVVFATIIFSLVVEKKVIKFPIFNKIIKNIIWGIILGSVWLGTVILFLSLIGSFSVGDKNIVAYLPIWFLAVLFNVIMQNYLVRGYLFALFSSYNECICIIIIDIYGKYYNPNYCSFYME